MDLLCDDVVYYEVGTWVTSLGSGSTSLDNSDLIIILIHLGLTSQPYTYTNLWPHCRRASVI